MYLEKSLHVLDTIFSFSVIFVIPCVFLFVILFVFRKKFSLFYIFLISPFALLIIIMTIFPYLARENISNVTKTEDFSITVSQGISIEKIKKSLTQLKYINSKNSHPIGDKIYIQLTSPYMKKKLSIRADSNNIKIYWLYDEDFHFSQENNIGYLYLK